MIAAEKILDFTPADPDEIALEELPRVLERVADDLFRAFIEGGFRNE